MPPSEDFQRRLFLNRRRTLKQLEKQDPELRKALSQERASRARKQLTSMAEQGPPEVAKVIASLRLEEFLDDPALSPKAFIKARLGAQQLGQLSDQTAKTIEKHLEQLRAPGGSANVDLDRPLHLDPAWRNAIMKVEWQEYLRAASSDAALRKTLEDEIPDADALTNRTLAKLVVDDVLDAATAGRLGSAISLGRLFGDAELGIRVSRELSAESVRSLAGASVSRWKEALTASGVAETTADAVASQAVQLLGAAYPGRQLTAILERWTPSVEAFVGEPTDAWINADKFHPGLGLIELINEPGLDTATKQAHLARRLNSFRTLHEGIPDLRDADLHGEPLQIVLERIPEIDRLPVVKTARTLQRLIRITGNAQDVRNLLDADVSSAEDFVLHSTELALTLDDPQGMEIRAGQEIAEAAKASLNVLDRATGRSLRRVGNKSAEFLRDIPDFEALFGASQACLCEECRSVLSPAAYFVSLMHYIDTKITRPTFGRGRPADPARWADLHPLHLARRRPDLFERELTCAATHDETRYLTHVIEVMSTFVARSTLPTGLPARHAARSALADTVGSVRQPFEYAHALLGELLAHGGVRWAELASAMGAPSHFKVGISSRLRNLVVQPDLVAALPMAGFRGQTLPVRIEAETVLLAFDVDRPTLEALFSTDFVTSRGAFRVVFRSERRTAASVQPDLLLLTGLDANLLDRAHRFLRLSIKLRLTPPELDLLVEAVGGDLDVDALADALSIRDRLQLDIETLCGLIAAVPARAATPESQPPFERWLGAPAPIEYLPRHLDPDDRGENDSLTPKLAAWLRLERSEVFDLITWLAPHLAIDLEGARSTRLLRLDASSVARLLRCAVTARACSVSVSELREFCEQLAEPLPITGVMQVGALVDRLGTLRRAGFRAGDLAYVLGTDITAEHEARAATMLGAAQRVGRLVFAPTLFVRVPGVTEQQSIAVISANAADFVAVPGGYRLATGAPALTAAPALRPALLEALGPHRVEAVAAAVLAEATQLAESRVNLLLLLIARDRPLEELFSALRSPDAAGSVATITDFFARLQRLSRAVRDVDEALLEVMVRRSAVFGVATGAPSVELLERLGQIAALDVPLNVSALDQLLLSHSPAGFANREALATVLGVRLEDVPALPQGHLAPGPVDALDQLRRAAALAKRISASGAELGQLLSNDVGALTAVTTAMLDRLDQKAQQGIDARLDELERSALIDYLLHSFRVESDNKPAFISAADLVAYFLIDVEMGKCGTTTSVAEAISACQLYLRRCREGWERTQRPEAEGGLVVRVDIPDPQFSTLSSYRVHEVVTKIALYPGIYCHPTRRHDMSPTFRECFVDGIEGRPLSESAVYDAYANYLRAFEELASLTIAGSYYDDASDKLYVFGVNSNDPPTYYLRVASGLAAEGRGEARANWGPYTRMEVQIPVKKVTAIVHRSRLIVFWVTIQTQPVMSPFVNGASTLDGYDHTVSYHYTWLKHDGMWTPPQVVSFPDGSGAFPDGAGLVRDDLDERTKVPDWDAATTAHARPRRDYTLTGLRHELVYPCILPGRRDARQVLEPERLGLVGTNSACTVAMSPLTGSARDVDFNQYESRGPQFLCSTGGTAFGGSASDRILFESRNLKAFQGDYATAARLLYWPTQLGVSKERDDGLDEFYRPPYLRPSGNNFNDDFSWPLLTVPDDADLLPVGGKQPQALLQSEAGRFLVSRLGRSDETYVLHRLDSKVAEELRERVFDGGLEALLGRSARASLAEPQVDMLVAPILRSPTPQLENRSGISIDDPANPNALYWREIQLEAPLYCAALASQQGNYELANRFLRYVVDFSTDEVFQYAPFAALGAESLADALAVPAVQETAENDPFNPFAWAQDRPLQRAQGAVFLLCENLFAQADSLFVQMQREQVDQARMIYLTILEILGDEPRAVPDCGPEVGRSYGDIETLLDEPTLLEAGRAARERRVPPTRREEATIFDPNAPDPHQDQRDRGIGSLWSMLESERTPAAVTPEADGRGFTMRTTAWKQTKPFSPGDRAAHADVLSVGSSKGFVLGRLLGLFGTAGDDSAPVFCVPENPKLAELRARCRDRLAKIRACRDINNRSGAISPFAPEIPVELLLSAQAAGIPLQDLVGANTGRVPPMRFTVAIALAKAHAADLASLIANYYAATQGLEVEQRSAMELTHQLNLMRLRKQQLRDQLRQAEKSHEASVLEGEALDARAEYLRRLLSTGLIPEERTARQKRSSALSLRGVAANLEAVAGLAYLIPQLGAPTAMTYGGRQFGDACALIAKTTGSFSALDDATGAEAALAAADIRRSDTWAHELAQVEMRLEQHAKVLEAADLAVKFAKHSVAAHDQAQTQLDELVAHQEARIVGRDALSAKRRELGRLLHGVVDGVVQSARLAERCLRYERGPDAPGISGIYFDPDAEYMNCAQVIQSECNAMQAYFEQTHVRKLELDQMFSLSQIAPDALWRLKVTGDTTFTINPWHVLGWYPGVVNCRIRGVRLTVNAVVGPYANIPLTLELLESWVRRVDPTAETPTTEDLIPPEHTARIATSRAQNDAGVFKFDFDDARYLPFEGAGVASRWRLRLPRGMRRFDYYSISDVVMSIAYEADYDEDVRTADESDLATLDESINQTLRIFPYPRIISLRDSFGAEFGRLKRDPAGTPVPLTIEQRHFEYFLQGRNLRLHGASLHIVTPDGTLPASVGVRINGREISDWVTESTELGLTMSTSLGDALGAAVFATHMIELTGDLTGVRDVLLALEVAQV